MNHTPGPWIVRYFDKNNPEAGFFVEAKNNNKPGLGYGIEIMGDDFGDHIGYPTEQRKADAHLIAAAPDMYNLLRELLINPEILSYRSAYELRQKYLVSALLDHKADIYEEKIINLMTKIDPEWHM